jgi:hypothetical protein
MAASFRQSIDGPPERVESRLSFTRAAGARIAVMGAFLEAIGPRDGLVGGSSAVRLSSRPHGILHIAMMALPIADATA